MTDHTCSTLTSGCYRCELEATLADIALQLRDAADDPCAHPTAQRLYVEAADEIERLRAQNEAWRARDGRQVDQLRQALDDVERWQAKVARATDENEQLRVDSQWWEESSDQWRATAERLQALIDAWVAASLSWGPGEPMPDALVAAEHDLLAAATKEDDRG